MGTNVDRLEAFLRQEVLPAAFREVVTRIHAPLAKIIADHRTVRGKPSFVAHFERTTRQMLAELPSAADIVLRLDAERASLQSPISVI